MVHQPQPRTAWYSLIPRVARDWLLEKYHALPTRPFTSSAFYSTVHCPLPLRCLLGRELVASQRSDPRTGLFRVVRHH